MSTYLNNGSNLKAMKKFSIFYDKFTGKNFDNNKDK